MHSERPFIKQAHYAEWLDNETIKLCDYAHVPSLGNLHNAQKEIDTRAQDRILRCVVYGSPLALSYSHFLSGYPLLKLLACDDFVSLMRDAPTGLHLRTSAFSPEGMQVPDTHVYRVLSGLFILSKTANWITSRGDAVGPYRTLSTQLVQNFQTGHLTDNPQVAERCLKDAFNAAVRSKPCDAETITLLLGLKNGGSHFLQNRSQVDGLTTTHAPPMHEYVRRLSYSNPGGRYTSLLAKMDEAVAVNPELAKEGRNGWANYWSVHEPKCLEYRRQLYGTMLKAWNIRQMDTMSLERTDDVWLLPDKPSPTEVWGGADQRDQLRGVMATKTKPTKSDPEIVMFERTATVKDRVLATREVMESLGDVRAVFESADERGRMGIVADRVRSLQGNDRVSVIKLVGIHDVSRYEKIGEFKEVLTNAGDYIQEVSARLVLGKAPDKNRNG